MEEVAGGTSRELDLALARVMLAVALAVVVEEGSSKVGGGNMGLGGTFPVPEGPPPPTRRRTVLDVANCCCRARTSRPEVTYPACISCLVKVSSASPIPCR